MICPKCKSDNSKCIDSRQNDMKAYRIRRYECMNCGGRFTTKEVVVDRGDAPVYTIRGHGYLEKI